MDGIFILGRHSSQSLVDKIGGTYYELPNIVDDCLIHDFVVSILKDKRIDKIVIDLNESKEVGLATAFHIRLSPTYIKENVLTHILFVFEDDISSYLRVEKYGQIFLTPGVSYCDSTEAPINIQEVSPLSVGDYIRIVLKSIIIPAPASIGRHSLANQWGAFILSTFISKGILPDSTGIKQVEKTLYFKSVWVRHLNEKSIFSLPNFTTSTIKASSITGKKILLIDDEAEKGWDSVLRAYFQGAPFKTIHESVNTFDDFKEESKAFIKSGNYDLVFLDLRLNGLSEDDTTSVSDFSGLKVLKEIKSINPGIQIIMFTASNKAWNYRNLLKEGADGFYIKESPEFYSTDFSVRNFESFKEVVGDCIKRSSYLKKAYSITQELLNFKYGKDIDSFIVNEIKNELELGLKLIFKAETNLDFALSYITLYPILELLAKIYINPSNVSWWEDGTLVASYKASQGSFRKESRNNRNLPSMAKQIVAIYHECIPNGDITCTVDLYNLLVDVNDRRVSFVHKIPRKVERSYQVGEDHFSSAGYMQLLSIIRDLIYDFAG